MSFFNLIISQAGLRAKLPASKTQLFREAQLFEELFAQNKEAHSESEGRKTGDLWTKFVENVLPTVLVKCYADKQFLAKIAQRGVLACTEACPIAETTNILSKSCPSKNLKLAEFSVQAIS